MTLPLRPRPQFLQLFRIIGGLVAVLVALVLSGCSAVKLGYNNAPELSYWWIDSYLDFTSDQTKRVRADLNTLQTWHRQNELPVLASTLAKMQRMAPNDVSTEQLCDFYAEIKPRFQVLIDRTEPLIAAIAPTLQPEQLEHLARQLEKRSVKWQEEWLEGTLTERRARRVKQLQDRAEMLYGRLEERQLAMLRAGVATSSFDAAISYRESQRRHQDTLQVFRQLQSSKASPQAAKAEVHALLSRAVESPDVSYKNHMDKVMQENCKAFSALHNSSTPEQRLKLIATLKGYETDAQVLMLNR